MSKKKNSKSNLSATPYDYMEADQESTSTRDSADPLDPTPPPDSLSASVEYLKKQFANMATAMQNLTDQVTAIDKKLISSTVTTDFSKPSADQVLSTSETQSALTNVKNQLADSLTLTPSDPYADSLFRPSFHPLFNSLLCPSSNLLDISLADLYIYNVLFAQSPLHDKTIFPQLYRPQYSYIPIKISTIPFLFCSISTLATSTLYFWVTPPLRPPDPTFTKQGLLTFGN